jgi:hypothetical protein
MCQDCGKQGSAGWQELRSRERQQWVWTDGDAAVCKPCATKRRLEAIKYGKERAYYAKVKTKLYPRPQIKAPLRRLRSEEAWEGTASFYQSWRPASSLAELVQAIMGRRKDTGLPEGGPSGEQPQEGAAQEGGEQRAGGGGASGDGAAAAHATHSRRRLQLLDEELQEVDEEDLESQSSASGSVDIRDSDWREEEEVGAGAGAAAAASSSREAQR